MQNVKNFDRLLNLNLQQTQSVFLFGPRGTGKTFWLKQHLSDGLVLDLLKTSTYNELLANPSDLEWRIPEGFDNWIIIDEVQKIPALLSEVHRLIEDKHYRFILTGSSARSLKQKGVDLLAGRALNYYMHPLTCFELGSLFSLSKALKYGLLPMVYQDDIDIELYLESYITTYLREEILQEGITRNIGEFARFLEIASFSQGATLSLAEIGREAAIDRRVVSGYFNIVEDLLLGLRLPCFTKRAKRRMAVHPKFYFFDVGIYRILRPKGPLDSIEEIDGAALETLFLQHLRALNDYYRLGYQFYFWRTNNNVEVDFIAYGERGLHAFEIKRKKKISRMDMKGLQAFKKDYDMAKLYLIYGGDHEEYHEEIKAIPFERALFQLLEILQ
jgi:predicted AAA+ superfamily ATPase